MQNLRSVAFEAFIEALPDDVYSLCPCACGMKVKWAMKDKTLDHQERFIQQFLAKMREE